MAEYDFRYRLEPRRQINGLPAAHHNVVDVDPPGRRDSGDKGFRTLHIHVARERYRRPRNLFGGKLFDTFLAKEPVRDGSTLPFYQFIGKIVPCM